MKKIIDFIKQQINNDVVLSSILSTAATAVVKLVAAAKEITVAYQYGIGDDLDAFLIAYLFSTFIITIFSVALAPGIIPTYLQTKQREGEAASAALLGSLTTWGLAGLIVVSLSLLCLSAIIVPMLGSGFAPAKTQKAVAMAAMMLPVVLIWGTSSIWGAVLNAHRKFFVVALSPVFISISLIIAIVVGAERFGIYALVIGTLVGHGIELTVVGFFIRREGMPIALDFSPPSPAVIRIFRHLRLLCFAALMSTGMMMVDQAMAGMLAPGSVSALNYGYRLVGILISLSSSLWIVALPHFSELASDKQMRHLKKLLARYLTFTFAMILPLMILLVIASEPIIRLVFERGAFSSQDTILVAQIQRWYLLQLPFCIAAAIMMRMLSALNLNTVLMWGGGLSFVLNLGLNYLFIGLMGVKGIALSTSVVSIFSFGFLGFIIVRYLQIDPQQEYLRPSTHR